ncbi:molybdenum cofactor biosynthesis protein MoaE [Sphingomonas paeninsulae]|jgi:molybdopterin synthase catalytic subunit|uniref:Molybdopterin synthase catalytic subunit n=1 Tax=Sphingomonas paeninsulae TaxID=2319844 RepID=A0A494TJX7_SPHPE|nr:molybdenum cofactor biosynthesis protein MoaE [Sphingomonas paeninsulae]AYJ87353.1 molybdenum cofactor biosynthesis protein MoaE [Sphingomonas paeninsulae]
MIHVRIETEAFDAGAELDKLSGLGIGAIASFIGVVRADGGLTSLTLDHYPVMTERALHRLAEQATERWDLSAATIIHRVGTMAPGERIVFVGTSAMHRAAALDGCAFLIDALKTRAPFWKRESFGDGRSNWVEAKQSDDQATARWD